MLSQTVVNKINDQIKDELRNVDSICSSPQEKMEAIERIAKLKDLLTPQPSRSDIIRELAIALKEQQSQPTRSPAADLVTEIFATFRR